MERMRIRRRICGMVLCFVAALLLIPALSYGADRDVQWGRFQNSESNNGVMGDVLPPTSYQETALKWGKQLVQGYTTSFTPPLIIDGDLYTASNRHVYKINKETGEIRQESDELKLNVGYAMNPITYDPEHDQIYVPILRGRVQCLDAETLQSKWISKEYPYTQTLSPITYKDGAIYTGIWETETADGVFFRLNALTGEEEWTFRPSEAGDIPHGFYWAGAFVNEKYVVVGSDDGTDNTFAEASDSPYPETAIVYCFDRETGKVMDRITGVKGDVRSTIVHDNGHIYFTSKGGRLYKAALGADGKFAKVSYIQLKDARGTYDAMMTATPVVYNGRIYAGAAGSGGQFSADGGHMFAVIADDETLSDSSLIYTVPISGYPQAAPVLSTATEKTDGKVRLYFTFNAFPGGIYYLEDSPQATAESHEKAHLLFRPETSMQQYCISPLACDREGTLYFKNDSGCMMAVGSSRAWLTGLSVRYENKELEWDTAFESGLLNYALRAPNGAASVDLYLTVPDGMTATVNGSPWTGPKMSVPVGEDGSDVTVSVSRSIGGKDYTRTYQLSISTASNNANLAGLAISDSNTRPQVVDTEERKASSVGVGYDPDFDPGIESYVSKAYAGSKAYLNIWVQTADPEASVKVIPVENVGNTGSKHRMNDKGEIEDVNGDRRFPIYWVAGETAAVADVEVTSPSGKVQRIYRVTLTRGAEQSSTGEVTFTADPANVILYTRGEGQSIRPKVLYNKEDVTDRCTWESTDPEVASVDAQGVITAVKTGDAEIWIRWKEAGRRTRVHVTVEEPDEPEVKPDPPAAPAAVKGLTAGVSASGKKITLSWKKAAGAENYCISYRTAGSKKWTEKKTSKTEITLKGLAAGGLYEVKCAGENAGGTGKYSTSAYCYIAKTTLTLKAGKKQFTAKMKKVKGASGYELRWSLKKNLAGAKAKKTGKVKHTAKKLKAKKTYYVQVRPYRKSGGKIYLGEPVMKKVKVK